MTSWESLWQRSHVSAMSKKSRSGQSNFPPCMLRKNVVNGSWMVSHKKWVHSLNLRSTNHTEEPVQSEGSRRIMSPVMEGWDGRIIPWLKTLLELRNLCLTHLETSEVQIHEHTSSPVIFQALTNKTGWIPQRISSWTLRELPRASRDLGNWMQPKDPGSYPCSWWESKERLGIGSGHWMFSQRQCSGTWGSRSWWSPAKEHHLKQSSKMTYM